MKRLSLSCLFICCLVVWVMPAQAAKVTLKLGHKVPIEMRREEPTFSAVKPPVLMDRDTLLQVGWGLWKDRHKFFFRKLSDYSELTMSAPVAEFLAAHPDLFPGAEGSGFPKYRIEKLLFLDQQTGRAAIYLYDRTKGAKKHYLLWWDLKENKISGHLLLKAEQDDTKLLGVNPVWFDPQSQEFFCRVDHWLEGPTDAGRREISFLALTPEKQRTVAEFKPPRYLSKRSFLDLPRRRVLFVEYAEKGGDGPPPKGHLINLDSGLQREIATLMTTYGVAFGPQGKVLYLYSNQLRTIQAMDLESGKVLRKAKVGGGGHDLAWPIAGKLMLLRHAGMHVIDPRTLKRKQFLPHKPFIAGHIWIPGSYFAEGRAFIRSGKEFLLMELGLVESKKRKVKKKSAPKKKAAQ